jgi:hypothetical protein
MPVEPVCRPQRAVAAERYPFRTQELHLWLLQLRPDPVHGHPAAEEVASRRHRPSSIWFKPLKSSPREKPGPVGFQVTYPADDGVSGSLRHYNLMLADRISEW